MICLLLLFANSSMSIRWFSCCSFFFIARNSANINISDTIETRSSTSMIIRSIRILILLLFLPSSAANWSAHFRDGTGCCTISFFHSADSSLSVKISQNPFPPLRAPCGCPQYGHTRFSGLIFFPQKLQNICNPSFSQCLAAGAASIIPLTIESFTKWANNQPVFVCILLIF